MERKREKERKKKRKEERKEKRKREKGRDGGGKEGTIYYIHDQKDPCHKKANYPKNLSTNIS